MRACSSAVAAWSSASAISSSRASSASVSRTLEFTGRLPMRTATLRSLSAYGPSILSERHGSRRLTGVTDDYQGPERRSAESMLARELVLVKRREEDLRKELELT